LTEAPATEKAIAVHCVAGLGRAPVLVALALIEYAGYDPVEAVSFLRKHRRGAINDKQLQYLEQYKRQTKAGCACIIM
jgi:protein tyrosine phosphatase type 4A